MRRALGLAAAVLVAAASSATAGAYTIAAPCEVRALIPAAKAERLLVICKDHAAWEIAAPSGRVVGRFDTASDPAGSGGRVDETLSADGQRVAISYRDGTVRVWPAGPAAAPLSVKRRFYANSLRFAPDGRALFADGQRLIVGETLTDGGAMPSDFGVANDMAFSADGKRIAIANADTTVRLLDAATLEAKAIDRTLTTEAFAAAFARGDATLIVGAGDGQLIGLDPATFKHTRSLAGLPGESVVGLMAVSRASMLVMYQPQIGAGTYRLLDLKSWKLRAAPTIEHASAFAVWAGRDWAFSTKGAEISAWTWTP